MSAAYHMTRVYVSASEKTLEHPGFEQVSTLINFLLRQSFCEKSTYLEKFFSG
jgi:hypothetical protein